MKKRFNNSIKKRIRKGTNNNSKKHTIRQFNFFKILLNVKPILIELFIMVFILRFKKLFAMGLT
jgi:hypothetical protein